MFIFEILKAVLFGIVEGITEWLPVSSTGHLILLNEFINLKVSADFQRMFDVVIQLGAILAVIVIFFNKLNPFDPRKSPAKKKATWELWFKVCLAILPSGVVGILFDDWMEAHLHSGIPVAIALIVYGVAFIFVEKRNAGKTPRIGKVWAIDYKTALLIGCFQCLSLVPGTSRSGSTILGAILLGVSRSAGSEFSFFMAIPTMLGASAIKLLKFLVSGAAFGFGEFVLLLVGTVVSFLVSMVAIKALMNYVRKHSFSAFGVYRIVLGVIVLVYFVIKGLLA
ncbi:MAG: undecaprenyl-diphosphate phosphatase [Ruminococcaceae bacterium]|nr:undecaprenyl-diphosphate phosphatase [Oscillospiraceae bacterium]